MLDARSHTRAARDAAVVFTEDDSGTVVIAEVAAAAAGGSGAAAASAQPAEPAEPMRRSQRARVPSCWVAERAEITRFFTALDASERAESSAAAAAQPAAPTLVDEAAAWAVEPLVSHYGEDMPAE